MGGKDRPGREKKKPKKEAKKGLSIPLLASEESVEVIKGKGRKGEAQEE